MRDSRYPPECVATISGISIMTFIFLHPKHRRNVNKIILFGVIWFAFGILYALLEKGILGEFKENVTSIVSISLSQRI
jgi:hypothetical protein